MEKPTKDPKRTVKAALVNMPDEQGFPDWFEPGSVDLSLAVLDGTGTPFEAIIACPGCGHVGGQRIGFRVKPPTTPSWAITEGVENDPTTWTLAPSVNCQACCGWHGFLTRGMWKV